MERKGVWIIGAAIVVGALILGISHAVGQGGFGGSSGAGSQPFARYQVVTVNAEEIIIMDVTNGDLFSAKPRDVRPYAERPRPVTGGFSTRTDKVTDKTIVDKTTDKTLR